MKLQIISIEGLVTCAAQFIIQGIDSIQLLNVSDCLAKSSLAEADIVLLDIDSVVDASPENVSSLNLKYPKLKFIFLSHAGDKQKVMEFLNAGPKGFITKRCSELEIKNSIISVSLNQKFYCNKVLDILMEHKVQPKNTLGNLESLTEREMQIVKLISKGLSTHEIADSLNLSHHTINTHRKKILRKWEINSPVELVLKALEFGIIN
ncbi:response regulator transcription factor [Peijinzhouia sedimentorum]